MSSTGNTDKMKLKTSVDKHCKQACSSEVAYNNYNLVHGV